MLSNIVALKVPLNIVLYLPAGRSGKVYAWCTGAAYKAVIQRRLRLTWEP